MLIEESIKLAIYAVFNEKVRDISRAAKGEFNKVFIVTTDSNKYVIRVFRHGHWPEDGKLQWIENQLTQHLVPHAKLLHYTRDTQFFPYGFMLSEYINGINGSDAILEGHVSFEDYHKKLAELLYKINQISVANYGLISNGNGEFETLLQYKEHKLESDLQKISNIDQWDNALTKDIRTTVITTLQKYEHLLRPVLVHGDATPDNSIYTPSGDIVLVDWDGALADSWVRDYSWITYWGSHLSKVGSLVARRSMIKEAFTTKYTQQELEWNGVGELERMYHIMQATELIPYYYFDQKNIDAYDRSVERLKSLLASNRS